MHNLDDMSYDIDSRIKYLKGQSGSRSGTLKVNFIHMGKRVVKTTSWEFPNKLEIAAINEMMNFLKAYPPSESN